MQTVQTVQTTYKPEVDVKKTTDKPNIDAAYWQRQCDVERKKTTDLQAQLGRLTREVERLKTLMHQDEADAARTRAGFNQRLAALNKLAHELPEGPRQQIQSILAGETQEA